MANCADFVAAVVASGQIATLPAVVPNTILPLSFSRTTCKAFALTLGAFTVVDFSVVASPSVNTPFSYAVMMYRVTGTQMTPLASTVVTESYATFSKELSAGTYVVCFQTSTPVSLSGTVVASYRGFQSYASFSPSFSTGESFHGRFDDTRKPMECNEVLHYEMIDGSLPPGLRLTGLGQIRGVAPNLDCLDDAHLYPAAQNWSFTHNDGTYHPWGRQWRFKVRVSVEGAPETFAEEWFCVKIHNNWSIDRDAFVAQSPFTVTRDEQVVTPVRIPELCPAPVESTMWVPQPIPVLCAGDTRVTPRVEPIVSPCPTCADGMEEVVEAIPIPFGLPSLGTGNARMWLADVKAMAGKCAEFAAFVARLEGSPVYQQYLREWPVELVEEAPRVLTLRTYSDDPNTLFQKWRAEEASKLPWSAEALGGESMYASLAIKRQGSDFYE